MPPGSMTLIDSFIIGAHQHATGRKRGADHGIGRSRGGLSTGSNAVVDEDGLPVRLMLTAGQAHDLRQRLSVGRPETAAMSWPIAARKLTGCSTQSALREPKSTFPRPANGIFTDPSIAASIVSAISSSAPSTSSSTSDASPLVSTSWLVTFSPSSPLPRQGYGPEVMSPLPSPVSELNEWNTTQGNKVLCRMRHGWHS